MQVSQTFGWLDFCFALPPLYHSLNYQKTFCSDPHPHDPTCMNGGGKEVLLRRSSWLGEFESGCNLTIFGFSFFPLLPNHDDACAAHIYTWQISTGPGTGDMFDIQPRCSQLPPIWSGGKQDNFLATLTLSHISRYVWYFSRDILGMSWGVQYFTLVSVRKCVLAAFLLISKGSAWQNKDKEL